MTITSLKFSSPHSALQIQVLERYDEIGNCGMTLLQDICTWRPSDYSTNHPETVPERDNLYKALAEALSERRLTNYVFSDNVLKAGSMYGPPRATMYSLVISTGGFAEYLIRAGYGRITCSHRMGNSNHSNRVTWSIIQMWIWTPPKMQAVIDSRLIESGLIKKEWLRGRERIFKLPEELKISQPVSTKW